MKIYRNGKEIVLTDEEIMEAHAEHIKSFMRNELITVYGLPEEEAEDYAELAYSHYTSGNGYTEYDCILTEDIMYPSMLSIIPQSLWMN